MKNEISTTASFVDVIANKRAGDRFSAPVDWAVGRPTKAAMEANYGTTWRTNPSVLVHDSDRAMMWKIFDKHHLSVVVFRDSFAPYGAERGTIVCFKEPVKHNGLAVLSDSVEKSREKKAAKELEILEDQFYITPFLDFIHYRWVLGITGGTMAYASAFMVDVAKYGWGNVIFSVFMVGVIAMLIAIVCGMGVSVIQEAVRDKKRKALENGKSLTKELSVRKIAAIEDRARKIAEHDEVFFVGKESLVPNIVEISDIYALRVRDKLRLTPTGNELQSWCETVIKIHALQSRIDGGFPVDMIPSMSEDAKNVQATLQATVDRLKKEWTELQLQESEAVGQGVSVLNAYAADDSKAAVEGAEKFLSGLTASQYNNN